MNIRLGFVGDVHGNLRALRGLWGLLGRSEVPHVVFLGDYLNKGLHSREVLQELVSFVAAGRATLLAGNHETALLQAMDSSDVAAFLKMGGAATIRSYVGERVGPDVLGEFRARLPVEHLEALRQMPLVYETDDLVAQHLPPRGRSAKFAITAHTPVGALPRVDSRSARLDTGCGRDGGRLTAFFWPSRHYIQVGADGVQIH